MRESINGVDHRPAGVPSGGGPRCREEFRAPLPRPEEVRDVVHPVGEAGPVGGPGLAGPAAREVIAGQDGLKLGIGHLAKDGGEGRGGRHRRRPEWAGRPSKRSIPGPPGVR